MRGCGRCKQEKPADDFYADRKRRDGLQCQCKMCTARHHDRWRQRRRTGAPLGSLTSSWQATRGCGLLGADLAGTSAAAPVRCFAAQHVYGT